ncbi:MAG: hypothetical protein RL095_1407 [Verrucomicrobiota bacterium]
MSDDKKLKIVGKNPDNGRGTHLVLRGGVQSEDGARPLLIRKQNNTLAPQSFAEIPSPPATAARGLLMKQPGTASAQEPPAAPPPEAAPAPRGLLMKQPGASRGPDNPAAPPPEAAPAPRGLLMKQPASHGPENPVSPPPEAAPRGLLMKQPLDAPTANPQPVSDSQKANSIKPSLGRTIVPVLPAAQVIDSQPVKTIQAASRPIASASRNAAGGLFGEVKQAKRLSPMNSTLMGQTANAVQPTLTPQVAPAEEAAPAPAPSAFRSRLGNTEILDALGNVYCRVEIGSYYVGADAERHIVPAAFTLAKYPVTKRQFFDYMLETGVRFSPEEMLAVNTVAPYDECPMVMLSWNDAKEYCRWLRKKTGEYYNLPFVVEWEAAARGKEGLPYPWGTQDPTTDIANFQDGSFVPVSTAAVDYYESNVSPCGCVGMVGNVMEWTNDSYEDDREPHILKGGSWRAGIDHCNTWSDVISFPPDKRMDFVGLRLLYVPKEMFPAYKVSNLQV